MKPTIQVILGPDEYVQDGDLAGTSSGWEAVKTYWPGLMKAKEFTCPVARIVSGVRVEITKHDYEPFNTCEFALEGNILIINAR